MASQGAEPEQKSAQAPPKRMSKRRQRKMLIAIGIIVVALVVVFWGWSSTGAKSFTQVSALTDAASGGTAAQYMNRTLEVQGVITGWGGGASDLSFTLADKAEPNKTIAVTLVGTLPAEFANGKTAVVKGELDDSLPLTLSATEITLGCASKY